MAIGTACRWPNGAQNRRRSSAVSAKTSPRWRRPNGETFVQFRDRVLGAWEQLAALPGGSHTLLVTHGGVMRVILPTVLGMPLNRGYPLHIPFACISRVLLNVEGGRHRASLLFHNAGLGGSEAERRPD